jgi:YD repeat-containing protein
MRDQVGDVTGENATTYGYNALDQVTKFNSSTATYAYNGADEVIQTPALSSLTYDVAGELASSQSSSGTTTYTYDSRGDRTSRTAPGPVTTNYGYDQAN